MDAMTPTAHYLITSAASRARKDCDNCGDDGELRLYPHDGWTADDVLCRDCFAERDGENDYRDFELVQEAHK